MPDSAPPVHETKTGTHTVSLKSYGIVILAAFALRAGWGAFRAEDATTLQFPDEQDYWSIAQSIAAGDGIVGEHGFRALRMPLYPGMLAVVAAYDHGVVYARVMQWTLGALAAAIACAVASRVAGPRPGYVAAALVACDPFLIFFSSLLLTETIYVTAQCALIWIVVVLLQAGDDRRLVHWAGLGLLSGLCIYARESSLPLCLAMIALCVATRWRTGSSWLGGAVAWGLIVVALLPWAIRNQRVTGNLCWLTHRGGISLYDGVRPQATGASDLGNVKQMDAVRGLDEVAWNRYFRNASIQHIKDDPVRIARLAAVKIARTWNPLPNVDTYQSNIIRLVSAAWTIPVYLLAAGGAVALARKYRAILIALLLPALTTLLLHSLFVGSVRYRIPAMAALEIVAGIGLIHFVTFRRRGGGLNE